MSGLIEFLKRLFGAGRPDPALFLNPFPPLHKEAVRRATRLAATAKADGFREFPQSGAAQESPAERAVRARCEQERDRYLNNFDKDRQAYVARLREISDSLSTAGINRVERVLVDKVVAVVRKDAGPIANSAMKLKRLADELRAFRANNDLLDRSPRYHDTWRSSLVLLVVFAIEVIVTTFLLRESGGLVMVLIIAAMYCFLNCLVPFFAAHPTRWIHYRRGGTGLRKAIGWLTVPVLIALGAGLNLLVGHYRSEALAVAGQHHGTLDLESLQELASRVNQIGATALREFVESPFGIGDTWSWLLAVAGFAAFLLSLREGHVRNDIHPGYGELAREYEEQVERYDDEVRHLTGRLQGERDRSVESLDNEKLKLTSQLQRAPRLTLEMRNHEHRHERALRALNDDYRSLVEEYRQANRDARSTPEPVYFKEVPSLDDTPIAPIDMPSLDDIDRQDLIDTMASFSNKLHDEFDRLVADAKPSVALIDGRDPLAIAGRR